jgi:hypothetical protein
VSNRNGNGQQKEIVKRYRSITDLWVAYHIKSDDGPETFGREFYVAVGELIQGVPPKKLELHHIDVRDIVPVVQPDRSETD